MTFPNVSWRRYEGSGGYHVLGELKVVWCYVSGVWHNTGAVKAVHIVPPFIDCAAELGEILFGRKKESLRRAGNSLLMSTLVKHWYDNYELVIVPLEAKEIPIIRWKIELLNPDIRKELSASGHKAEELHEKELKFLNSKRQVPRFLYFRFIMALIRVKDLKRSNWQETWARYYEQRLFPTLAPYMRKSMLLALATNFGTADMHMHVVESWITHNGFESPLRLTEETTEAARRVHLAVEADPETSDDSDEEDDYY